MKRSKSLSDIEWNILKFVWKGKKVTVKEVWQRIYPNKDKAYTTVQTYMDRLVEKGVLSKEKIGLVNFYSAVLSEKAALKQATASLVGKAFNGSYGLLAQFLIDSPDLSDEDLMKIKELIQKKEGA